MRPVNLIPAEERRGDAAASRTGPLAYVVVGVLFVVLAGVAALVLTGNQISDRKAELSQLKVEAASAEARANRLSAYTSFHQVSQARTATITSLADSRFDWERVIREVSLVLPPDVWLTNLTGTATAATTVEDGATVATRSSVAGPALQLVGCAPGQEGVARLVTALKEIDGVTRVGVNKSSLPTNSNPTASTASTQGDSECQSRDFLAKFEIVAAFDAAPVPAAAAAAGAVPAAPAPAAPSTDTASSTTASTGG